MPCTTSPLVRGSGTRGGGSPGFRGPSASSPLAPSSCTPARRCGRRSRPRFTRTSWTCGARAPASTAASRPPGASAVSTPMTFGWVAHSGPSFDASYAAPRRVRVAFCSLSPDAKQRVEKGMQRPGGGTGRTATGLGGGSPACPLQPPPRGDGQRAEQQQGDVGTARPRGSGDQGGELPGGPIRSRCTCSPLSLLSAVSPSRGAQEELKKLYAQLEVLKTRRMAANNPHLPKKRGSRRSLGRSLVRRLAELPEAVAPRGSREERLRTPGSRRASAKRLPSTGSASLRARHGGSRHHAAALRKSRSSETPAWDPRGGSLSLIHI